MFYDKEIQIIGYTEGYKDKYGIWHKGTEIIVDTIECDVQPVTKDIVVKDFGLDVKVEYRIFCPVNNNIVDGIGIKHKGNKYKVERAIIWEDYIDMIVSNW